MCCRKRVLLGRQRADRQPARRSRAEDREDHEAEERMRRHKPRVSRFMAGIIGILVIFAACSLVFGGSLPFSGSPFVLKAMFTSNTELHIPSPVRIAGVEAGQVTSVTYIPHSRNAAIVTMDI